MLRGLLDDLLQDPDKCLSSINGNWTLIYADAESCRAIFATDRMGAHRICYRLQPNGSLIASSNGELVAGLSGTSVNLDPNSLLNYFFFSSIPSPSTAFTGVRALGPAELIDFNGVLSSRRYWKPNFAEARLRSRGDSERRLVAALESSVRSAIDGRQAAAFLSGGLDSSTVVGMASRVGRVKAYTIGFDEKLYDETPYARIAAEHFHVPLSVHYVSPADVMSTIETVSDSYDQPFGNSSAIPTYVCARLAKAAGESYMLAGDGGDELFAGNVRYQKQRIFSYYERIPQPLRSAIIEPLFLNALGKLNILPVRKVRRYVEQARIPMPDRLQTYNFLIRDGLATIFTPDFLSTVDTDSPLRHMRTIWDDGSHYDFVDRMLFLDWKLTLADNDLRKVTTMCEAAGIEVRYPMLDHALIDLCCQIPGPAKMRNGRLRGFYKDAVHDFLPPEIVKKSKHGFGLPFGPWFAKSGDLRTYALDLVGSFAKRNIIRSDYAISVRDAALGEHPGYFGEMIWLIIILECWLSRRSHWRTTSF